MNLIAQFWSYLDTRRELQRQLDWRQGMLVAIGNRQFPELPPMLTPAELLDGTVEFQKGYHYGMNCGIAICAPDDLKTPREKV